MDNPADPAPMSVPFPQSPAAPQAPQPPTVDLIPSWLAPPAPSSAKAIKAIKRDSLHATYENMFDHIIDSILKGRTLKQLLEEDCRELDYQSFLNWIYKNDERRDRYYMAQEIRAEVIASEMLDIADASDSIEDVARSTLRINTRKWLLGVSNRKRFGETKQIEQNVTIDLSSALAEARSRVMLRDINADRNTIDAE